MVQALQTIAVAQCGPIAVRCGDGNGVSNAGKAYNVIPQKASFWGTIRTLDKEVRALVHKRLKKLLQGIADGYGCRRSISHIKEGYPVTSQSSQGNRILRPDVAARDRGRQVVSRSDKLPVMGGEDFSYMLEERPGAFIFMGNGDTAGLHHEEYDFNDEAIPVGSSYWAKIVETAMPAG